MTDRIPLAQLTKASLDALYDELAALRQVARGYCPACGRGDAAPTVADWERERQRAEEAEDRLAHLQATSEAAGIVLDRTAAERDALGREADRLRTDWVAQQERADQAERERDTARQSAAAIAAQRDRLRQRMNTLADRWDLEGPPPGNRPLTELRAEISVAPFDPDGAMTVQEYTERGRHLWAFRCWGTDTCDGWLGLGHHTQTSALTERERHVAEEHTAPAPAATEATGHQYLSTGCFHGDHDYCKSMTGLNGAKRPGECKKCGAKCICSCHTTKEA
jgi:hypothetical protein